MVSSTRLDTQAIYNININGFICMHISRTGIVVPGSSYNDIQLQLILGHQLKQAKTPQINVDPMSFLLSGNYLIAQTLFKVAYSNVTA